MMVRVAIVEDEKDEADLLKGMLEKYAAESNGKTEFDVVCFSDAVTFLEKYSPRYDVVFMDIELPDLDGMKAARKLRELDPRVMLLFVTNMSQFAVGGYEVSAFDFIVKPLRYGTFRFKLSRVVERLAAADGKHVSIYTPDGIRVVPVSEIKYVEVMDHKIVWHTVSGDLSLSGSLKKVEQELPTPDFVKINHCYIVNLKYVTSVKPQSVVIGAGGG